MKKAHISPPFIIRRFHPGDGDGRGGMELGHEAFFSRSYQMRNKLLFFFPFFFGIFREGKRLLTLHKNASPFGFPLLPLLPRVEEGDDF